MLSCSRFAVIKNNSKFSIAEANNSTFVILYLQLTKVATHNSTFVILNSPKPTDLLKQEHGYRQGIRTVSQTTGPC